MKKSMIALRPEALIEARYNLTSKENDIIDIILNTIKDDGKYVYEIDIDKYKGLFKDGSSNVYRDMKRATKDLFNKHNRFIIQDRVAGKEFNFVWFSMLSYNDNEGSIYFEIGDTLKKLLLEVKKRIYYKLEFTLNFRSVYSKKIYYMLKSYQDTGWRIDKIDELKYKLNCPESYKNYAIFKEKVLDIAQKEINNGSDIKFTYDPIKTGRKVTNIKFYIHTQANDEISITAERNPMNSDQHDGIKQVKGIFKESITDLEAQKILNVAAGNIDTIREKYSIVQAMSRCENVVGATIQAIKQGWVHKKGSNKRPGGIFNNYDQRTYDIHELEKKLLGRDNDAVE